MLTNVLSIGVASLLISLFSANYAQGDSGYLLPDGTIISSMSVPYADEYYVEVLNSGGYKTVLFPDPSFPVKKLVSTVTTYTYDAKLHFTIDGIKYSYPIEPNSNTLLTFQRSEKITNVGVSIGERGFPEDAVHVGYEDDFGYPVLEESPPIVPKARAICLAAANKCDSLIKEELMKQGFTVLSTEKLPDNLHNYRIVVMSDIGRDAILESKKLKEYVQNGGGLVFLSGSAYWLQQTEHNWLGFSSAGYTSDGESAFIATDRPFDTELVKGNFLKQQSHNEHGAQYVQIISGDVDGSYSGGGTYAYHTSYGLGRIYYQADTWHSTAGEKAENNIKDLLAGGISWVSNSDELEDKKPPAPKTYVPVPTPKLQITPKSESQEPILKHNESEKVENPQLEYVLFGLPVSIPFFYQRFLHDKIRRRKNTRLIPDIPNKKMDRLVRNMEI